MLQYYICLGIVLTVILALGLGIGFGIILYFVIGTWSNGLSFVYATRNATDSWSVRWLLVTIFLGLGLGLGLDTIYKTKWLPWRLLFIRLKIVFVTISSSS